LLTLGYLHFSDRSKTEIKIAVLQAVANPSTILEIMHKVFVSSNVAKIIIHELTDEELLTREPGTNLYRTTEKGQKWLDTMR
jgi:predicted transcriptional regulator